MNYHDQHDCDGDYDDDDDNDDDDDLQGSTCEDVGTVVCCAHLANCQLAQEIQERGDKQCKTDKQTNKHVRHTNKQTINMKYRRGETNNVKSFHHLVASLCQHLIVSLTMLHFIII